MEVLFEVLEGKVREKKCAEEEAQREREAGKEDEEDEVQLEDEAQLEASELVAQLKEDTLYTT